MENSQSLQPIRLVGQVAFLLSAYAAARYKQIPIARGPAFAIMAAGLIQGVSPKARTPLGNRTYQNMGADALSLALTLWGVSKLDMIQRDRALSGGAIGFSQLAIMNFPDPSIHGDIARLPKDLENLTAEEQEEVLQRGTALRTKLSVLPGSDYPYLREHCRATLELLITVKHLKNDSSCELQNRLDDLWNRIDEDIVKIEQQCTGWEGVLIKREILECFYKHDISFDVPNDYFPYETLNKNEMKFQQQWQEKKGDLIVSILKAKSHNKDNYHHLGKRIALFIREGKWSLEYRLLLIEHYLLNEANNEPTTKTKYEDLLHEITTEFLKKDVETATGKAKGKLLIRLIEVFEKTQWIYLDFFTRLEKETHTDEIQDWMNETGDEIKATWQQTN